MPAGHFTMRRFRIGNRHRTIGGYTVLVVGYTVRLDWIHFTTAKRQKCIHELAAVVLDYNQRGKIETGALGGASWRAQPGSMMPSVTLHDLSGRFRSGRLPADLEGAAAPFGQPLETLVEDGSAIVVLDREPHPLDFDVSWWESDR